MHHRRIIWIAATVVFPLCLAVLSSRGSGEASNDFHFALLGDRAGDPQPQVYGRAWREIDLLHPAFVLNVGDSIPGNNDATAQQEWSELRAIRDRYKDLLLYFTPGNHDIWSEFSRGLYERETGRPLSYSFNHRNMHFTILDTSRTADLGEAQLQFLEQDLNANAASRPKLVVFHHPVWIEAIRTTGTNFPLHRLARKYGVEYIISGHGHRFVHRLLDGVTYMEVGSSGGTMRGKLLRAEGFADGCFYHFVWATVKGSRIRFTVKELGAPAGQGRIFSAEEWDEKGPRFDTGDPALKAKPES